MKKICLAIIIPSILVAMYAIGISPLFAATYDYTSGSVFRVHSDSSAEVTNGQYFTDSCRTAGGSPTNEGGGADAGGNYVDLSCDTSFSFQVADAATGNTNTSGGGNLQCASGQFTDYGTSSGQPVCTSKCSGTQVGDYNNGLCMSDCPKADIGSCTSPSSATTNTTNNSNGSGSGSPASNGTSNTGTQTTAASTNSTSASGGDPGLNCTGGTCTYVPLEPLPGVDINTKSDQNFVTYLNGIIFLLIIIGAMLAVARFSIGGIIFMTSDVAGNRSKAKSQMWACVWGLLLLISSVLILKTVNPDLVRFNVQDLEKLAGMANGGSSSNSGCDPTQTNCANGF